MESNVIVVDVGPDVEIGSDEWQENRDVLRQMNESERWDDVDRMLSSLC